MTRLWFLTTPGKEHAAAAEFCELASLVLGEARAVFDEVRPARFDSPAWRAYPDDLALLVGSDVLVLRRTLAALADRVAAGATFATPALLADIASALPEAVYTLGAFERVEAGSLAPDAPRTTLDPGPLSLWRVGSLAAQGVAARDPDRVEKPNGAVVGLAHRFIDYFGERREDALPYVPAGVREVLEIGCGAGVTGALLRERMGCRVTGIELNPAAARRAAVVLDHVIVGDFERTPLDGRFDLILALDVFEHLADPDRFLARASQMLAPGGTVLLSVPNVGHWTVVEELMAGRWDYLPIGILCFTHQRFYTRQSLLRRLQRTSFTHVDVIPQTTPVPQRFLDLARDARVRIDLESLATHGYFVVLGGAPAA